MKRTLLLSTALTLLTSACAVTSGTAPPALTGGPWLNTASQAAGPSLADLRGKVVIVNFWVYSCINCHNSLPTLKSWYSKYRDQGLEIVGIHTPEFESDKPTANVIASLKDDGVTWPILQDNDSKNWRAWQNQAWPTFYLIDRAGKVRSVHRGEISSRFPQAIPGLEANLKSLLAEK
ncbi:redoxin domain-containing protein [Deinococcus marmoris]|uniref:DipZ protein n=1 Tax=Deinococcus marmoris TaxID=249408 RepID=A0A1U7P3M7_9DEIO|nr:redoxin domain-containing protein [Deinococcus marmoris]OLV19760.1 DipZ protein [Deinococcus marmoris]